MNKLILILAFTGMILISNCTRGPKKPVKTEREMYELREPLVDANKYLVLKDHVVIQKYVERRNWDFNSTETGLWYSIIENSDTSRLKDGDLVTIKYQTSLLDGTLCYTSDSLGLKTFAVGSGEVEYGLDEAMLYLHKYDKAKIILPPHLAYGLLGDENRIPPRSIIMHDIEILKVN